MSINIQHLAKLAKLKIEDEKLSAFEKDMENIMNMVEKIPPISGDASCLDPDNPMELREDVWEQGKYTRKDVLANAPKMQAGCVVVHKTIE